MIATLTAIKCKKKEGDLRHVKSYTTSLSENVSILHKVCMTVGITNKKFKTEILVIKTLKAIGGA